MSMHYHGQDLAMGFHTCGYPQKFRMENSVKINDLGVPPFHETSIYIYCHVFGDMVQYLHLEAWNSHWNLPRSDLQMPWSIPEARTIAWVYMECPAGNGIYSEPPKPQAIVTSAWPQCKPYEHASFVSFKKKNRINVIKKSNKPSPKAPFL